MHVSRYAESVLTPDRMFAMDDSDISILNKFLIKNIFRNRNCDVVQSLGRNNLKKQLRNIELISHK